MRYRTCLVVAVGLLLAQPLLAQTRPASPPANTPVETPAAVPATAPAPEVAPPPAAPKDATEEWIQSTKRPTNWLTWGADQRLRDEYQNNTKGLNNEAPGHEVNWGRFRTRLWTTVTPIKDLDINARLIWEFKAYSEPEGLRDVDMSEALFDNLNVTWKNIGVPRASSSSAGRTSSWATGGWCWTARRWTARGRSTSTRFAASGTSPPPRRRWTRSTSSSRGVRTATSSRSATPRPSRP